jgi:hypothetical protein
LQFETIWSWLPHRYVIKDPALAFAASENGYSLNTLLNQSEGHHPVLIALRTKNKEVSFASFFSFFLLLLLLTLFPQKGFWCIYF